MRVPKENLISGIEGEGFKISMGVFNSGRIGIGVQGVGIAQAAFDEALKYVQEREQFGRKLFKFQALQFMLAIGTVEHIYKEETETVRYFTSSFTTDYAYNFNPKIAITIGIDVLYDGSLQKAIKGIAPEDVSTYQKMYLGSHMGYQYTIDRFTILFNFGTYFRQHSYDRGFWFVRAGGRIRITDHVYAHVAIKTKNGVRSDWIEWGAAYYLKIR